ncbi:unnamed protein product [Orchesella dallaii]|uniref:Uncharacterized protein n=1 Tax=Orchesella dallaii TaxID=48710 RepID=A0ABP1QZ32_9HEXA
MPDCTLFSMDVLFQMRSELCGSLKNARIDSIWDIGIDNDDHVSTTWQQCTEYVDVKGRGRQEKRHGCSEQGSHFLRSFRHLSRSQFTPDIRRLFVSSTQVSLH